jgi:hypothetical protein
LDGVTNDLKVMLAACREANVRLSKEVARLEDLLKVTRAMVSDHRKEIRELRSLHDGAGKLLKEYENKIKRLQAITGRKK